MPPPITRYSAPPIRRMLKEIQLAAILQALQALQARPDWRLKIEDYMTTFPKIFNITHKDTVEKEEEIQLIARPCPIHHQSSAPHQTRQCPHPLQHSAPPIRRLFKTEIQSITRPCLIHRQAISHTHHKTMAHSCKHNVPPIRRLFEKNSNPLQDHFFFKQPPNGWGTVL